MSEIEDATWLVVFGAAVRPDGSPSPVLQRRIEGAFAAGRARPHARYLVTGGVGRFGPAEARVMRDGLVALGADPARIVLEPEAEDTLASVLRCKAILDARAPGARVLVCTSPFHARRCVWLFRLAGVPAEAAPMPRDRPSLGWRRWLYHRLRELPATLQDVPLVLLARLRGRLGGR